MIASMTAFARVAAQQEWGHAIWEIRSVNHRYLDVTFKIPDIFRPYELDWRQQVRRFVQRGKIECSLIFSPGMNAPLLEINTHLVKQLLANCQIVAQQPGVENTVNAMELLKWPDALITHQQDTAGLKEPLVNLLNEALGDLCQARQREGSAIELFLKGQLAQVKTQIDIAQPRLLVCMQAQKQKIRQRINEMDLMVEPQRLEQELVFYAQRIDVAEELQRLTIHVKESERLLNENKASGRRLDFLMQEMNREANTLAAKALDDGISQAAIELKVLIEQMREQIQNVE